MENGHGGFIFHLSIDNVANQIDGGVKAIHLVPLPGRQDPFACKTRSLRSENQSNLQNEKNFESHLTKTHKWFILQI